MKRGKLLIDTIEKEGLNLSKKLECNGKDITQVYLNALTDSNFHTLRKKIAKLVNKECNWKLRLDG